jgi:hypothetical protein
VQASSDGLLFDDLMFKQMIDQEQIACTGTPVVFAIFSQR